MSCPRAADGRVCGERGWAPAAWAGRVRQRCRAPPNKASALTGEAGRCDDFHRNVDILFAEKPRTGRKQQRPCQGKRLVATTAANRAGRPPALGDGRPVDPRSPVAAAPPPPHHDALPVPDAHALRKKVRVVHRLVGQLVDRSAEGTRTGQKGAEPAQRQHVSQVLVLGSQRWGCGRGGRDTDRGHERALTRCQVANGKRSEPTLFFFFFFFFFFLFPAAFPRFRPPRKQRCAGCARRRTPG